MSSRKQNSKEGWEMHFQYQRVEKRNKQLHQEEMIGS